jgi:hypothetical protein
MDEKKINKTLVDPLPTIYVLLHATDLQLNWSTFCSYGILPLITNIIYSQYYYFIYAIILNMERERLGFGHVEVHIFVHAP